MREELSRKFSLSGLLSRSAWVAADNWSQQILQFISFLYVGNIIGPAAIGEMTVALTYMLLMHALLMNSVTDSIIQRADVTPEHDEAAFWMSAGMGLLAMLLTFPLAPLIAGSLGEPQIAPLILAISPVCLAMGIISFLEARIRRELRFSKLAGRSIASVGTAFVVAVILARAGFGVWSLVAYQLVWRIVELVFVATVAGWRPTGRISRVHFIDLIHYSLHNLGIRLVDFFAQNIGRILVGYLFGMAGLGVYQLARRFVEAPLNAVSGVFQSLTLPVFARLQKERREFAGAVSQTVQAASFLLLPAFTGLMLVAPVLVEALLKPEWAQAIRLIQIYALAGLLLSITYFFGTALLALGHVALTLRASIVMLVLRLALYSALAPRFGLTGLALAEVLLAAFGLIFWFVIVDRAAGIGVGGLLVKIAPAVWSTAGMAFAVEGFRLMTQTHLAPGLVLAGMIAVGAMSFGGLVVLIGRPDVIQVRKLLRAR